MRVADPRQQCLDPTQRQVDGLRVKRFRFGKFEQQRFISKQIVQDACEKLRLRRELGPTRISLRCDRFSDGISLMMATGPSSPTMISM